MFVALQFFCLVNTAKCQFCFKQAPLMNYYIISAGEDPVMMVSYA